MSGYCSSETAAISRNGACMRRTWLRSQWPSLKDAARRRPMPPRILLDRSLSWRQVGDVAEGASLALSDDAQRRIRAARTLVESIVRKGIRAYGVNTGVGALCDVVVNESKQAQLSRNIVMS